MTSVLPPAPDGNPRGLYGWDPTCSVLSQGSVKPALERRLLLLAEVVEDDVELGQEGESELVWMTWDDGGGLEDDPEISTLGSSELGCLEEDD